PFGARLQQEAVMKGCQVREAAKVESHLRHGIAAVRGRFGEPVHFLFSSTAKGADHGAKPLRNCEGGIDGGGFDARLCGEGLGGVTARSRASRRTFSSSVSVMRDRLAAALKGCTAASGDTPPATASPRIAPAVAAGLAG